ncbi:unnamed protein product [Prunus armeniaca]|uniref:FMN-dependent dehydrogenase domain-containing protein n=1 Tax=Prunus armeniaca TaxID=36596 RepID=A0A6J5VX95_PRUAR|nr:unnamed protein product [Prunus armeniaca]
MHDKQLHQSPVPAKKEEPYNCFAYLTSILLLVCIDAPACVSMMDRHELDKGSKTPRDGINQLMLLQVGRPVSYGLAAKGERGVRQVIEMLKDEFELTMALCGCPGVMDITRSHVRTECDKLHSML